MYLTSSPMAMVSAQHHTGENIHTLEVYKHRDINLREYDLVIENLLIVYLYTTTTTITTTTTTTTATYYYCYYFSYY